ncbi:endolytic transglycosylase MltG [Corynebacterium atypicum]|uniref:endolytic transglycosylase MltG n=1 Tax=Corynebacterium atypicum TaxID=191610 RepID=UPI0009FBEBA4|nr:endolytic transglycosylase MltG [Corynebacterium atypicum]
MSSRSSHAPRERARAGGQGASARRARGGRPRQRWLGVLVAAIVLTLGAVVYIGVRITTGGAYDYQGQGTEDVELVEVAEGSSVSELGEELEERDIVKTNAAFQSAAFATPGASSIEPGFYRMHKQMSAQAAVDALLDVKNRVDLLKVHGGATLMDVTVVGGDTRFGIYSMISKTLCGAHEDSACVTPEKIAHVGATADLDALGVPGWARDAIRARGEDPRRLEGMIVPGEYVLNPTMQPAEILRDLITRSTKQYESTQIEQRAAAVGLSPYDLATAASLVEREAPAGEFDKVARVILNRLHKPMKLEFDSTVNYGLAEQEVATTDADRAKETPWNTYAKEGLPATPIASPSTKAIEAMENPAEGNWLFFVTVDGSGRTVFNDDYESHLKDVDEAIRSGVLKSNREGEHVHRDQADHREDGRPGDAGAR